ncbi:Tar ligand binding domain-containing protein [Novosphingobium sp. Chol11]|uniref:Tar ligand binding domain-containing protein n=1 Tax=Novosphingobium sp. Chol11 TaxID=1385763 RepID=UPI0025E9046A|nr:Tar ligand binding domain-containing protein [Novosphingobium sp. Chol11]
MAIFGNLKIKTVALVGSLLLAGAAVGSAAMVLTATQALGSRLAYSAENTVPSLQLLGNVRTTMIEARLSLNKQVISSSEPELRQYRETTAKQIGTVDAALVTYRSMVSDDAERVIYDKVLSRWAD